MNEASKSFFTNNGQSCAASKLIYVHESISEKFIEKMKVIAEKKKVGDQFNKDTNQGAITKSSTFNKILENIKDGIEKGARVITGGSRIGSIGHFVQPTIFTNVNENMLIAQNEVYFMNKLIKKFYIINHIIYKLIYLNNY